MPRPQHFLEVRVSVPTPEVGQEIATAVVTDRLAACAQLLGPMTSTFRWEGRVDTEQEHLLVLKTSGERFDALAARVREAHPYDTPEILAVPVVAVDERYAAWLVDSLAGD